MRGKVGSPAPDIPCRRHQRCGRLQLVEARRGEGRGVLELTTWEPGNLHLPPVTTGDTMV